MPDPKPRRILSPVFVVCLIVLSIAAVGLNPTLAALIEHYSKEPIDLRLTLDDFDNDWASFEIDHTRAGIGPSLVNQEIGTEDYLDLVLKPTWDPDRTGRKNVWFFVTYYSDPRDTIPHTPEVCYRQSGSTMRSITDIPLEVPGLDTEVKARLLHVDQGPGRGVCVLYVIVCEGEIYCAREPARLRIGMPGTKYTYFSKVEAATPYSEGMSWEDAVERCKRTLAEGLPELMASHFPRSEDLQR